MYYEEKKFRELIKPLLEILKKTNISAEEITLFRVFFGVLTGVVLFRGNYLYMAIVITFYQFVMLLDYIDGSLARYRKSFKIGWVYFDLMTHLILATFFLLAVTFSFYLETNSLFYLTLGVLATIFFLFNNIFNKHSSLDRRNDAVKHPEKWKKQKLGQLISLFKIEKPFGLFFIFILLNLKGILIISYFIVYSISSIYKFCSEFASFKK